MIGGMQVCSLLFSLPPLSGIILTFLDKAVHCTQNFLPSQILGKPAVDKTKMENATEEDFAISCTYG